MLHGSEEARDYTEEGKDDINEQWYIILLYMMNFYRAFNIIDNYDDN